MSAFECLSENSWGWIKDVKIINYFWDQLIVGRQMNLTSSACEDIIALKIILVKSSHQDTE